MTRRYRIVLSYDGTGYHGWQKQPNDRTVQGELEKALSIILRNPVEIMGSGRTDTGVHAEHQVAHFDLSTEIDLNERSVLHSLRGLLNHDILVSSIKPVHNDFHARFDAQTRRYRYQLATQNNVFHDRYYWVIPDLFHFHLMAELAQSFIGEHDFTSFCKQNPDVNHNRCTVISSELIQVSESEWHYRIEANRFLHHMVRSIVSSLVLVGRGLLTIEEVRNWIQEPDKVNFILKAPANALFLEKVLYSD